MIMGEIIVTVKNENRFHWLLMTPIGDYNVYGTINKNSSQILDP